jgi:HPt (histidine-containing phosphotransfer) domain-containing protein
VGKKPVIDLTYLHKMTSGDNEIILETVQIFLKSMPQILINLQNYCDHQEWEKLAAEAHKIKPDLIYMGISEAHQLILSIETKAKNKETGEIEKQIKAFSGICNQALTELPKKVNELKSKAS